VGATRVLVIETIYAADGTESSSAQADFLAVLVMDRAEDTFRILHINRDTMTDITQIDAYGKKFGVFHAQIALSHAYGSAGKMQCRNTVDAVENLLYGVKMDHYISLTMDSVPILNDSLGGVRLTLADDFTVLGDEYLSGKEITLRGDQALTFVRWRSDDPTNSNLERMERQRQYIGALFSQYTSADTVDTLETMFRVNEYLVSDCTVDQLSTLIERVRDYRFDGTITLPGEIQKGDVYMEYHVDEPAAQKMIIDLFYKPEE